MRKPKTSTPRDAFAKGLGLLARREQSARELATKLKRGGHAEGETREAVGRLRRLDYQSDARFAASLARSRATQGYGPRRIGAELKSHGLDQAAIRAAIDAVDRDWVALARAQLRRRFGAARPSDAAERARRAQFLLRRGFDPATVRAVTRADVDDPGEEFD